MQARPYVEMGNRERRPAGIRNADGVTAADISSFSGGENSPAVRARYRGLVSGAFRTALQSGGICAIVIGGFGLAGTVGGFGWSTESLNQ